LAIIFLIIICYTSYARAEFSTEGGDIQSKIRAIIFEVLEWDGKG